jgi:SNF2 family DNA or RNA helicase
VLLEWCLQVCNALFHCIVVLVVQSVTLSGTDWKKLNSLMMQLRKCCNHAYQFNDADPNPGDITESLIDGSGKLAMLDKLLGKLQEKGHRVVLFSQFTSMLDILEDFMKLRGYRCLHDLCPVSNVSVLLPVFLYAI